jgi:gliding motility-associated-like protein
VVRIAQNGDVKWSTFLFTYLFDAGGLGVNNRRAVLQSSNKNIIIGDVVHKTIAISGAIKEGNLHFFELDYNTGKIKWETSYEYPVPASDTAYVPDIVNVKELPGGKFSFITTLYFPLGNTNVLIKKGANIITSNSGVIENVIAYIPADARPCRIVNAAIDKKTGNRTVQVNKDGQTFLVNIDDNGQILWQNGYNNEQGNFPFNCFSPGKNGYNIFMSNNNSKQFRLLITDEAGVIDCANEAAEFLAIPAALNYSHDSVLTDLDYNFEDKYYDYAHPLKRGDEYPLTQNIDCLQTIACCTDFIDKVNVNNINICEGKSYMLPDSTVIQDSGLYNVTFKTALGCDSIRYYKVSIDKDVSKLSVGNDTCLNSNTTITIKATEGFGKYYWMNEPVKDVNSFSITQPGIYYTRVENVCGNKTDSIEIFSQCDYPVDMPSAFTPNADLVNDYFRITPFNKNRLLNFRIYDRWGKMVFQTNNSLKGWDGTFKNEPQGAGTYVYYLEMMGYSGKTIVQKGYVNLIR